MLFLGTVERSPDRLTDKETHRLDIVSIITRESMVDSLWKSNEIPLFNVDPDPLVVGIAYIEVSRSIKNVADFFSKQKLRDVRHPW